jgi:hypothetical protein
MERALDKAKPTLKEAIADRAAVDDVATAAYRRGDRAIVIRVLRRDLVTGLKIRTAHRPRFSAGLSIQRDP